jgi:hypothetical protein
MLPPLPAPANDHVPPPRRDALAWYSMARRTRRGIVAIASGCAAAIVVLALLNYYQLTA